MRGDDFLREVANRPPFSKLHPSVAGFFKDYMANEKVISFRDQFVLNTHFPPYPSRAFDSLVEHFGQIGEARGGQLYSVTLAVTNRCNYRCWHCYNVKRSQEDLPLPALEKLVTQLQDLGAVMVTLTGGEPLLRDDLEQIAGLFDERSCLIVGTTGWKLTPARAAALRASGVFGMGVSLDSTDAAEHDRLRGRPGAFQAAIDALRIAGEAGLYPYVVSVATHDFLDRDRFMRFMQFAGQSGALEVHLLEPSATGKLAGNTDALLAKAERERILEYQEEVARDGGLPILSSYVYLESPEAFGCGAGLTHLYIDGSGEVCPCQLVPLSFGNVTQEPLSDTLERMRRHFREPRPCCAGRTLAKHVPDGALPTPPEISAEICEACLPQGHATPRFFHVRSEAEGDVGKDELRAAYDRVHDDYDAFWLTEAAKPTAQLIDRLDLGDCTRVFEAGCGTGYATALLAASLPQSAEILAADISPEMLAVARERVAAQGSTNVRFLVGDALEALASESPFDLVFSSWVLGYIPLRPFFAAVSDALSAGGRLAFVVHKENSPQEPLEIFGELVARDPSVLQKRVAFDFPRDVDHIQSEMEIARLEVVDLWDGNVVFRYASPEEVLEHLLKSGAGTAFHDALDPERRPDLERQFLEILAERRPGTGAYEVTHDYVACIAQKP